MASLKDKAKKAKTIFSLDSPTPTFFSPSWPDISPQASSDAFAILSKLLTNLQELQQLTTATATTIGDGRPKILAGPNPVTSYLEHLVQRSVPTSLLNPNSKPETSQKEIRKPLAVLVTRSDQPSVLYSHIPFLCAAVSVPLVALPKGSEQKLVKVLKPENGSVYMLVVFEDTPGVEELTKLLLDEDGHIIVGKVGMPEVLQPSEAKWLETRSKATQTFVGERRKDKRKGGEVTNAQTKGESRAPAKKAKKES
ncbi:hypothetical protein TWF106_006537 [Orbilia oligospora]|uniref:Uncharacterized protein n=1 Tax=Orbilia oligospora TaxID=2813651 RepID=A0A6G1M005_ORBOL|nr:hypothetical protein TWF788_009969 [Orbilia oligospora]KAF3211811.1 hypothetical protein TWF679_006300 [Orbilia oligospora]KAF3220939.1 hypothetical protein TWF106_006537 [Orbilia oligospora]KAF3221964.1 hypothetical protein TWF191_007009 [Orbilia oligospora]KAF3240084.1 hypothetical protein TWF192_009619 [Orbilia oligospora]